MAAAFGRSGGYEVTARRREQLIPEFSGRSHEVSR